MELSGHILVVDDDPAIRELLSDYLTDEGYRVLTAAGGEEMRRVLSHEHIDLVLLDLLLPKEDGLSLARYLHERGDVGIIIVSGKDGTVDRIVGLEMGADDYLTKPFHLREVLARIKSVMRRSSGASRRTAEPENGADAMRFAGWTLDVSRRRLLSPVGEEVHLTSGEYDLLVAFVNHPNRVLNRDLLLDLARNRKLGVFDRSIDVQVGRLRRKIEPDPQNPAYIKTVRGAGYIFTPKVERA